MAIFNKVEGVLDRSRFGIYPFGNALCIFYDNVPLWRTAAPLKDLEIILYDPTKYREQGEEDECYSLFCIDKYDDIYTYGMWKTLEEAKAWLDKPVRLY